MISRDYGGYILTCGVQAGPVERLAQEVGGRMTDVQIINGDAMAAVASLPTASIQCCVTSPPYWGLRDYGHENQIGLEDTPEAYVARLVEVFRQVRRALRPDGTLWLNLGDSYAGSWVNDHPTLKPKDLIGIPWRVAFALQADGWFLRSDIIWHKPNPMPESVTDRPTKAHEYIFLLSKSSKYYYDTDAVAEPSRYPGDARHLRGDTRKVSDPFCMDGGSRTRTGNATGITRNRRSVWTVTTKPYKEAHFATFPPDLIRPCIIAGSRPGDTVLDPFAGSGTTAAVAIELGRAAVAIELNPAYIPLIEQRLSTAQPPLPFEAAEDAIRALVEEARRG